MSPARRDVVLAAAVALLGLAASAATLLLGIAVTDGGRVRHDVLWARQARQAPELYGTFGERVSALFDPVVAVGLLLVIGLAMSLRRGRAGPLVVAASASAAATATVLGLKHAFARPDQLGSLVHGGAYPSGHTTTAVVVGMALVVLLLGHDPRLALLGSGLVAVGTAVLGLGLVLAGYHWVTDIAGGVLAGLAVTALTVAVARVFRLPTGW